MLTSTEYETYLDVVAATTRTLQLIPIQDLLDVVSHSETLGPILEPTTYQRHGARNLAHQRRILEAALGLQRAATEVVEDGSR